MSIGSGLYTNRLTPPTDKQRQILLKIEAAAEAFGRPPSYRELADLFEISVGAVQAHLISMRRKGLVDWERHKPHSLRVAGKERQPFQKMELNGPYGIVLMIQRYKLQRRRKGAEELLEDILSEAKSTVEYMKRVDAARRDNEPLPAWHTIKAAEVKQ